MSYALKTSLPLYIPSSSPSTQVTGEETENRTEKVLKEGTFGEKKGSGPKKTGKRIGNGARSEWRSGRADMTGSTEADRETGRH